MRLRCLFLIWKLRERWFPVSKCHVTRETSRSICSASKEGGIVTSLVGSGVDCTSLRDPDEEAPMQSLLTPTSFGHASFRIESLTNPPSVKASSLSFHRSTTGSDNIRRISSVLAVIFTNDCLLPVLLVDGLSVGVDQHQHQINDAQQHT
mmetsp:Transcript_9893/g.15030  ORF Transcript_9893/g.15030 Transcript_9893/m.15030 type:complete len:150 (-) Transcript_9893:117-566(-)